MPAGSQRYVGLNKDVVKMTREKFGMQWFNTR